MAYPFFGSKVMKVLFSVLSEFKSILTWSSLYDILISWRETDATLSRSSAERNYPGRSWQRSDEKSQSGSSQQNRLYKFQFATQESQQSVFF